jgi:hypothetical protein
MDNLPKLRASEKQVLLLALLRANIRGDDYARLIAGLVRAGLRGIEVPSITKAAPGGPKRGDFLG